MGPAILALVGVVIGALATGWITFLRDRRTERVELRAGKRVVALELGSIALDLDYLATHGSLALTPETLSTTAWEAEKRMLAKAVSDDLWDRIGVFYLNVVWFRRLIQAHGRFESDDPTLARAQRHALAANELRKGLGTFAVPLAGPRGEG